ncbi:uncharacterized protein NECHADRAFT_80405 [Fusarium vanettenii 77-13-4]|uniref:Uncharacterized protein n=1 Tax=Fusarium vanettenii (strain ATCC MYA-4622 / CBS 123669 / FGSC 9596 / NRRL 45880 / 77-13-4) TaxID=660122 RepID=C7YRI8_FUSV7|nr:uncharacterized protein NECHADRAFT_80405 [Fusarium vanettenii 77-13-4]EEU45467.1 hypothetical protein NECHADRAFT_80405 [Fusarium vanettenii 77-13-4]
MPDKMTKLKKPKNTKEREPDEVKARGEEKEKKKKRHSQPPPPSAPSWVWWLAGGPNQRKKRSSHKSSSKEKSSSKKHSTKERSSDKKKTTTTTTTKRKKHREEESESEDDRDETNSAAGDLGVIDGENDYRMMPGQAKQSNKNHAWIDSRIGEHHSSVGIDRANLPMPPWHHRPTAQPYGGITYTPTNEERDPATRDQGVCPQEPRRQDAFQPPPVQNNYRSVGPQTTSQTSSTSTAHQQPPAPQNDVESTSQENSTGDVDQDHGTLPTIQEEPPRLTSRQSNTGPAEQEQSTTTAARDTTTGSGDGCGVTDKGGDEQESKEPASPQAGENEPKISDSTHMIAKKTEDSQVKEQAIESKKSVSPPVEENKPKISESTDTTAKAEDLQAKEQVIESNDSQGDQQESQGTDESRVNDNESAKSSQSSSCTVT